MQKHSHPTEVPATTVIGGVDWRVQLRFRTPDGLPLDLSSWSQWRASWSDNYTDPVPLDVDVSRETEGVVVVSLPKESTTRLGFGGRWTLLSRRGSELRAWVTQRTAYRNLPGLPETVVEVPDEVSL